MSKVDKDGNEIAGVRLPEVAAPVATTTGWALRRAGFSENEGCEADGQHIPFKTTKAERLAAGDPRKSQAYVDEAAASDVLRSMESGRGERNDDD